MSRRLESHPIARREALDAAIWYARVRLSLGYAFLDELERAEEDIAGAPDRWPEIAPGLRRFLMHRFPYQVVYRVTETRVTILAVAHASRRPGYWRDRH